MEAINFSRLIDISINNKIPLVFIEDGFIFYGEKTVKYYPSTNTAIIDRGYCGHVRHKMTAVKLDKLLKGTA